MKKCFTVNPNRTVDEILSYEILLKNNIYQGVEIFYPYNKTKEEQEEFKKALKTYLKYDVEFICHLPYGILNNPASYINLDETMDRFFKAIDFSNEFGVKKLTLHPGCVNELSRNDAIILASQNIKKICQYARKYGMMVMLENLIGEQELMRLPQEYFELKKLVDESNLKFIFDVAHFHASKFDDGKSQNIIHYVEQIKDDLYHLHLCDNLGERDTHSRIGTGNIDFETYFKYLKEIGYSSTASSEVLFNTVDDLIQTAKDIDKYDK